MEGFAKWPQEQLRELACFGRFPGKPLGKHGMQANALLAGSGCDDLARSRSTGSQLTSIRHDLLRSSFDDESVPRYPNSWRMRSKVVRRETPAKCV